MHETVRYFNDGHLQKKMQIEPVVAMAKVCANFEINQYVTVMNAVKIIGIILIIIGVAILATGGFHFKEKKKIPDSDVIDIHRSETRVVT